SPIPRPPRVRSSDSSSWANSSKICGSFSGSMPTPRSRIDTTASPPAPCAVISITLPGSLYLAALWSRLAKTCERRIGSACRATGEARFDAMPHLLQQRLAGVERAVEHRRQQHGLAAQLDLAGGDAADVEQVVDQAHELRQLPLHHRARAVDGGRLRRGWIVR